MKEHTEKFKEAFIIASNAAREAGLTYEELSELLSALEEVPNASAGVLVTTGNKHHD